MEVVAIKLHEFEVGTIIGWLGVGSGCPEHTSKRLKVGRKGITVPNIYSPERWHFPC